MHTKHVKQMRKRLWKLRLKISIVNDNYTIDCICTAPVQLARRYNLGTFITRCNSCHRTYIADIKKVADMSAADILVYMKEAELA